MAFVVQWCCLNRFYNCAKSKKCLLIHTAMMVKTTNVILLFVPLLPVLSLSVVKTLSVAACHWVKTRGIWGMLFHNRDCMISVWKSLGRRVISKGRSILGKWVDLGVGCVFHSSEKLYCEKLTWFEVIVQYIETWIHRLVVGWCRRFVIASCQCAPELSVYYVRTVVSCWLDFFSFLFFFLLLL